MVGIIFVNVDAARYLGFMGFFKLRNWMFEHNFLDICCFGLLICMCFVFLYLHLFSEIEHVLHGKAL